MRSLPEVAQEFLRVRRAWRQLQRESEADARGVVEPGDLARAEARMRALGWALEVDVELMNAPKITPLVEGPRVVTVTPVEAYGSYLLEFPANERAGTEFWAAFADGEQLRELLVALSAVAEVSGRLGLGITAARMLTGQRGRMVPVAGSGGEFDGGGDAA